MFCIYNTVSGLHLELFCSEDGLKPCKYRALYCSCVSFVAVLFPSCYFPAVTVYSYLLGASRAPNDARFGRLSGTMTDIHPLQVCRVRRIDPLNCLVGDASARKRGNGFPLLRHRHHSCDHGNGAMLSAQLCTLCFQAL